MNDREESGGVRRKLRLSLVLFVAAVAAWLPAPLTLKACAKAGSGWDALGYAVLALLAHGLVATVLAVISVVSGLRVVSRRRVVLW